MRSARAAAGALLVLALLPPPAPAHEVDAGNECRCDTLRDGAGWCGGCGFGWIAGHRVESRSFLEAIDTHGHPVDTATLECAGCREAAAAGHGICASCGWGILDGRIYASRLTYFLALGDRASPAEREAAAAERDRLERALERLPRCETCAVACVFGSACPECGISYAR